jgi:cell division septal protein FtsQ
MSRPEQVRRRTQQRTVNVNRAFLLAACLVAVGATALGLWHEASNPRFAVQIEAIEGLGRTSSDDVINAAALAPGQNAWLINRNAVARRIEALPWVDWAVLRVSWPNHLVIFVSERRPVARVALAANAETAPQPRYATIDETQRVLSVSPDPAAFSYLPVFDVTPPPSGDTLPASKLDRGEVRQALDAYRRLSALGLSVTEVAIAPSTGISATADRNFRVLFGEDEDLAEKAQLFHSIMAKISTPSHVAYIDVRSIHAPTVLYR